jgi:hypothetical protein
VAGELGLRVHFRERPPGLIEIALLLSITLTTMSWMVGAHHDEIFHTGDSLPGAWPTVLFGIPTLLIGWLVARVDGETLSKISLTSLFMMFWLACNSLGAVLAVAFKSSGVQGTHDEGNPKHWLFFLSVPHPIWAVLMISCLAHTVFSSSFCISRAARYLLTLSGLTYRFGRSEIIDD